MCFDPLSGVATRNFFGQNKKQMTQSSAFFNTKDVHKKPNKQNERIKAKLE